MTVVEGDQPDQTAIAEVTALSTTSSTTFDVQEQSDASPPDAIVEGAAVTAELAANDLDLGVQVRLDAFSGPLDLLLYLVRRSEVAITDISLTEITDQFIATIEGLDDLDLDTAGDFILMAATLLEMKARVIRPADDVASDDDDDDDDWFDPRADLIRQLLAYRGVKQSVGELEALERQRHRLHSRATAETIPSGEDEVYDLSNADPYALFSCWEKILGSIAGQRDRTVMYDDIPLPERLQQITDTMATAREGKLSWLLEREPTRVRQCGVVVALLESIRQLVLETTQHEQYGDVELRYIDPEERQRPPSPLPPQDDQEGTGKKRRRRRRPPLMTYQAPVNSALPASEGNGDNGNEDGDVPGDDKETQVVLTEEQRFTAELNDQFGIDPLLQRIRNLDQHLAEHIAETLAGEEPDPPTLAESEATSSDESDEGGNDPEGPAATEDSAAEDDDEEEYDGDEEEYDEDDEEEYDDDEEEDEES